MLFGILLDQVVKTGSLRAIAHDGSEKIYGDGTGDLVTLRLHDKGPHLGLALNPYLKLGEAYMDGDLTIDPPHTIYDLLEIILSNLGTSYASRPMQLYAAIRRWKRRIDQHNPVGKAQANVAHHYDLDGGIYDLFLDIDKQYSCAYYAHDDMSLEEAQSAKKQHIIAKLDIEPHMRVLDIGCGWGGMAISIAETTGARVVGVTLSKEQHKVATERAAEHGLSDRVEFRLQDYRLLEPEFDRIVSVGMFEHVGIGHYAEYFDHVQRLLNPDGVALIHTIGRLDPPAATNPWIAKYIFPGGYIPALSEMSASVERSGLLMTDIEILRLHYAKTLREWRRRFMARRDEALKIYDERFCRMWEFYLAGSETSFRYEGMVNFQMQLARKVDALPLTRTYMLDETGGMSGAAPVRRLLAGD
ncbi:MAG: class I SAM-dependent methyltransferase [Parvibaculaceae bacterium]